MNTFLKNIINMRNTLFLAGALFASVSVFNSCEDPIDPVPDQKPTEKVDTVRVSSMTGLDEIQGLLIKSNEKKPNGTDLKNYIISEFQNNAKLSTNGDDIGKLKDLITLLGKSNVKFDINSATLVPATDKINLSDEMIDILVTLWDKGLKFAPNTAGQFFYIISAQESKLKNDEQKKNISYSDALKIEISKAEDFGNACRTANAAAKEGKRVSMIFNEFTIDADSLILLNQANDNKNIQKIAISEVTANVRTHPTAPIVINSTREWIGVPIKMVLDGENAKRPNGTSIKPVGGVPATVFNDSTFNYVLTAATSDKEPGTYTVRFVDKNNQLTNPIISNFANTLDGTEKSVDNSDIIPMDVTDIYQDEKNMGYKILIASSIRAGNTTILEEPPQTVPILVNYNKNFNIHISNDKKYTGEHQYDINGTTKIYDNFTRISINDLQAMFKKVLGLGYRSASSDYNLTLQNQGKQLCFVHDKGLIHMYFNTNPLPTPSGVEIKPAPEVYKKNLKVYKITLAEPNNKITWATFDMGFDPAKVSPLNIVAGNAVQRWR